MKKNPYLAAFLNLLFFGAGYIYNGKRVLFGVLITIALWVTQYGEIQIFLGNESPAHWAFIIGGLVFAKLILAYDGFVEAKSINAGSV